MSEVRLIDANALEKMAIPCEIHNGALTELCVPLYQIRTAPTVDITEEQAIDKLHETGWMQKHDKEMTERTTGKECELFKRAFLNAVETSNLIEKLKQEAENEADN